MIVFESFFFFFFDKWIPFILNIVSIWKQNILQSNSQEFLKWISTLRHLFSLYLFVKAFSKTIVKSFTFKIKFNFS